MVTVFTSDWQWVSQGCPVGSPLDTLRIPVAFTPIGQLHQSLFLSLAHSVAHKLSCFEQKRLSTCIAFYKFDASICIHIHVYMTLSSLHIFFPVKRVALTQELIMSLTHTLHLAHIDKVAHVHAHTLKQICTCKCTQCLHHSLSVVCVYVCVYMYMIIDRQSNTCQY